MESLVSICTLPSLPPPSKKTPANLQRWLNIDPQTSWASLHSGLVLTGTEAAHVLVTAMVLHGSHLSDCWAWLTLKASGLSTLAQGIFSNPSSRYARELPTLCLCFLMVVDIQNPGVGMKEDCLNLTSASAHPHIHPLNGFLHTDTSNSSLSTSACPHWQSQMQV